MIDGRKRTMKVDGLDAATFASHGLVVVSLTGAVGLVGPDEMGDDNRHLHSAQVVVPLGQEPPIGALYAVSIKPLVGS